MPSTNDLSKMDPTFTRESAEEDLERWPQPKKKTNNELIGSPSEVALLRYVELVASVEGIRNRYKVGKRKVETNCMILISS